MLNFLEFNNDFRKMYNTNLIKLYGTNLPPYQKFFEHGDININTGQNSDSNNKIRLIDYISVKPKSKYLIKSNSNSNVGIRFYDKNKKYLGSCYKYKKIVFETPENCYYIRFIIETTELDYTTVIVDTLKILPNLKINLTFEQGSINYTTGQNQNLSSTLRTDFIKVQENETYKLRYYNENIVYGLRCYGKDKNYINGEAINSNIITIPSGVHFIRLIRKDLSEPNEYLERI